MKINFNRTLTNCTDNAYFFRCQFDDAVKMSLDPQHFLEKNDSNTYFNLLNDKNNILKPGHTGTNVMDIQLLLISAF